MIAFSIIFCSLVIYYVDTYITHFNVGNKHNGFGRIEDVVIGRAKAPMQTRPLLPWIMFFLIRVLGASDWSDSDQYRRIYQPLKAIYAIIGLSSFSFLLSTIGFNGVMVVVGILLISLFCLSTILYDYDDYMVEVACISMIGALVMIGSIPSLLLSLIVYVLYCLIRETSLILVPFALSFNVPIGICFLIIWVFIKTIVGKNVSNYEEGIHKECPISHKKMNWKNKTRYNIESFFYWVGDLLRVSEKNKVHLSDPYIFLLFYVLCLIAVLPLIPGNEFTSAYAYSIAMLIPIAFMRAIVAEVRVFTPVFIFIVPLLLHSML